MTIKFHVSNDILVSYSAGTLDEASSLLVATHLALCPHCRARSRSADSLGGYLLESLEEAPVSSTMKDAILSQSQERTRCWRWRSGVAFPNDRGCDYSRSAQNLCGRRPR